MIKDLNGIQVFLFDLNIYLLRNYPKKLKDNYDGVTEITIPGNLFFFKFHLISKIIVNLLKYLKFGFLI
jgi:hypothetical protein